MWTKDDHDKAYDLLEAAKRPTALGAMAPARTIALMHDLLLRAVGEIERLESHAEDDVHKNCRVALARMTKLRDAGEAECVLLHQRLKAALEKSEAALEKLETKAVVVVKRKRWWQFWR